MQSAPAGGDPEGDALSDLQAAVVAFSRARGWNRTASNLAISVAVEAAELLEVYQWHGPGERLTDRERGALALECADVLSYLLQLCAAERIDLALALRRKIEINEARFPGAADDS